MISPRLFLTTVLAAFAVEAAPSLPTRQAITTLTSQDVAAFKPYTYFASAGYCQPGVTSTWLCGTNCQANAGFKPLASGGDGISTRFWFVGYDPTLKEIIVSHQGTIPSQILPVVTDLDIVRTSLDPNLFPGVPSSVEVHSGFKDAQAKTATEILAAVQQGMSIYQATSVTSVGHSLGAAISLLDAVYLPLHLPSGTTFNTITYGLPRVGNQAFAQYVDAHAHLTHINNKEDPIPILPGRFLGFHHPSGEVHIQDSGEWDRCPGQDNTDSLCSTGDVPSIFEGNTSDHDGPYDGVEMGC
jgi:hypothetical protein